MAILSSKEKKLVLSDIYQWILDNYPYFRRRGPGWRNSIRHNLSLNDCFVKSGRSANGKGHYWAIHPANTEDFTKGDFRRRRAQRKVRKAMGLSVPDEEDSPSPSPTPPCGSGAVAAVVAMQDWQSRMFGLRPQDAVVPAPAVMKLLAHFDTNMRGGEETNHQSVHHNPEPAEIFRLDEEECIAGTRKTRCVIPTKKRLFDVESLLAPDTPKSFTINRQEVINRENEKRKEKCQSPRFHVSPSLRNIDDRNTRTTRFDGGSNRDIASSVYIPNDAGDDVKLNNDVHARDDDDDENGVDVEEIKYDSSDEVEDDAKVNDHGRKRTANKESVLVSPHYSHNISPHQLDWRAVFQQSRFHSPSPFSRSMRPLGGGAGGTAGPQQSSTWAGDSPGRPGRYSPLQRSPASTGHTLRPVVYSKVKSSDGIKSPNYKHCCDVEESDREVGCPYLPRTIKLETS